MRNVAEMTKNLFSRRWQFICALLCISMIAGLCLTSALPRVYSANTVIFIDPENMPELVAETNPAILSESLRRHAYLTEMIMKTDLFSDPEYENMLSDERIGRMRENISVAAKHAGEKIFLTISFKGESPEKTAAAVNYLADLFIKEKIRLVTESLEEVSHVIEKKLDVREEELDLVENALREYRTEHKHELPDTLNANLNTLAKLREQSDQEHTRLRDKKSRLIELGRQMKDIQEEMENYVSETMGSRSVRQESQDATNLGQLKKEFVNLTARYTDRHPDVIKMKRKISELEARIANQAETRAAAIETHTRETQQRAEQHKSVKMGQIKTIKARYENLQRQAAAHRNTISGLRGQIRAYEKRIEKTPRREQDIMTLKRAYHQIQEMYTPLLKKKADAEMALMEWHRSSRQKFRVLEPADIPRKPVGPDIRKWFRVFLGAGLGMGTGLAAMLDLLGDRGPISGHHMKSGIWPRLGQIVSVLFIMITLTLVVGFGVVAFKGAAYMDDIVATAIHRIGASI